MPSHQQISGQLLDDADAAVIKQLRKELQGEYVVMASDGWKDKSRDSINGVNISVSGKVRNISSDYMYNDLPTHEDISYQPDLGHITQEGWGLNALHI